MQHGKVSQQSCSPTTRSTPSPTESTPPPGSRPPFRSSSIRRSPTGAPTIKYFRSVYGIDPARIAACSRQEQAPPLRLARPHAPATTSTPTSSPSASPAASPPTSAPASSFTTRSASCAIAEKIGGLQILFAGKAHPADNAGKGPHPRRLLCCGQAQLRFPEDLLRRKLRLGAWSPPHPGRRRLGQHPPPPLRGLRNLRHEGCSQRRSLALHPRRLVDRRLRREHHRLGHRRRRLRSRRGRTASTTSSKRASLLCSPTRSPGRGMQQHCIGINGSFFNTHRMLSQYISNAYFPYASVTTSSSDMRKPVKQSVLV